MHNYHEYHIWYSTIFMDFYILDENFIEFLWYIDCMGIIPMGNDICLVDICTTNSIIREAKYFWFLWQEEGIILAIADAMQW